MYFVIPSNANALTAFPKEFARRLFNFGREKWATSDDISILQHIVPEDHRGLTHILLRVKRQSCVEIVSPKSQVVLVCMITGDITFPVGKRQSTTVEQGRCAYLHIEAGKMPLVLYPGRYELIISAADMDYCRVNAQAIQSAYNVYNASIIDDPEFFISASMNKKVIEQIRGIKEENRERQFFKEEIAQYITSLHVFSLISIQEDDTHTGTDVIVRKIEQYIDTYISEPEKLSIPALAANVHVSEASLRRMFKKKHKKCISDFIQQKRAELAKFQIMRLSEKPSVIELALSFGYESEKAFSKAFKRNTGVSPITFWHEYNDKKQTPEMIDTSTALTNR